MLWSVVGVGWSQFYGVRSHFLMSGFLDNPAGVGSNPCLDLRLGVRSQWAGFEGAPTSSFASLSGRLSEGSVVGHGLGGFVQTDETGPWSNTRFSMAYSSKIRLSTGAKLSAGFAAGMAQYKIDIESLDFPVYAASDDPVLFGSSGSQVVFPSLDFGLWYEDASTFVSFSVLNVMATTLTELSMTTSSGRNMVLMGGKVIRLDRRFSFRPAAQMRLAQGLPASLDIQGMFTLENKVSMGLGYRTGSALVAVASFKVWDAMTLGYAYDFGVSSLHVASRNSHEIVLSLTACDQKDPYIGPGGRCAAYD
ncbi:MAG: hypothetical protein RLZZ314_1546 [Bacteroidota bacterium]|jgi:type IX secretion system PorP/SprF family membrane protein